MVNILPLPTDNLYKFCALVGVVIIGVAVYWEDNLVEDVRRRSVKLSLETKQAKIEVDYLQELSADVKRVNMEQVRSLKRDIQLKVAEMESAQTEIKREHERSKQGIWDTAMAAIVGGLLAIYGFGKWYVLQKQQDKLLGRQIAGFR